MSSELPEIIFTKPEKLHITFGVMSLAENENRMKAEQLLEDCREKIVK